MIERYHGSSVIKIWEYSEDGRLLQYLVERVEGQYVLEFEYEEY